ncbi:hypothetical protein K1719_021661 [Acacia pycnantha]|nr:hypothetical protein K1719_021661 [Acacia pycnantha]
MKGLTLAFLTPFSNMKSHGPELEIAERELEASESLGDFEPSSLSFDCSPSKFCREKKSKCVELKRELRKEWEHVQELSAENDERCKAAQIAMREVEEKEKNSS